MATPPTTLRPAIGGNIQTLGSTRTGEKITCVSADVCTLEADARKCGRANGKDRMAQPRYQDGCLFVRGKHSKVWAARWREDLIQEDGTLRRTQRTVVLGSVAELSRREARSLLQKRVFEINQGRHRPRPIMSFEKFAKEHWLPSALLALKPGSVKIYQFNLDKYAIPSLGSLRLCDVTASVIRQSLLTLRSKGYAASTLHAIRVIVSKVLQAAVEMGYLERNAARGIQIGGRESTTPRIFLTPSEVQHLLAKLGEPCRTVVLTAVLTGMRIGEILALRWDRVDFLRGNIEVSETYSDGHFGSPKTRSSRRVIPISSALSQALELHRESCTHKAPRDLVFSTDKGTPLSPKNLYNRALAPACDSLDLPRVSWHSFRHANATLMGDIGESIKTAQSILGHSDIETTLNTYMHAIPDSQRRAVERVAKVLLPNIGGCSQVFPDVPKFGSDGENREVVSSRS
jgi:integrase